MDPTNPLTDPSVRSVLGDDLASVMDAAFGQMEWAEEEIAAAKRRHPDQAEQLHASFKLLRGTHELMRTESVYRGHAREILERVAAGQDTRPATNAELACGFSTASLNMPLGDAGQLAYIRVFAQVYPEREDIWGGVDLPGLEQKYGAQADQLVGQLRSADAKDWRVIA
jgi:hypothetical protein